MTWDDSDQLAGSISDAAPPFWTDRRWRRSARRLSLASYVAAAFAFSTTILIARILGTADFGLVTLASGVATSLMVFFDLSFEEAIVHFGTRCVTDGDGRNLRRLIRTALTLEIAIGLAVACAVAGLGGLVADVSGRASLEWGIIALAVIIPLMGTADGVTAGLLLVAGRADLRAYVAAVTSAIRLGIVITGALLWGVAGTLIGYAVAALITASAQGVLARRLTIGMLKGREMHEHAEPKAWRKPLFAFSGITGASTALVAARVGLIPFLVGHAAGVREVALLGVAMLPVTVSAIAGGPLRLAIISEQARLAAREDFATLGKSIRKYMQVAATAAGVGVVLGWLLMPALVTWIYGSQYDAAVNPARILLIAAAADLVVGWAKPVTTAVGRPGIRTAIVAGELGVAVIGIIVLRDRGALGGAITLSVLAVLSMVSWISVRNRLLRPRN